MRFVWLACIAGALCTPAFAGNSNGSGARGFADFARDLVDLERLARIETAETRMESSYDRSGGNQDGFDKARLRGNVYTIAELRGPGVVRRIYTARPGGRIRIFIDGGAVPVVDMLSEEFFAGRTEPFLRPAVGPMGFANYSFFPIPYARSLRIEALPVGGEGIANYGLYYQVTYHTFPAGTRVKSLRLPLAREERRAWDSVLAAWRNTGVDPKPVHRGRKTIDKEMIVAPGSSGDVADITGAGAIDRLFLKVDSTDPNVLRTTLLRIRWDEQPSYSVDCPIGDFFGNGFNRVPYRSLAMGLTDGGYYSYFSMPFGSRAAVTLVNESGTEPVRVRARLVYRKTGGLPADTGYFHAKWRREDVKAASLGGHNLTGDENYRVLEARGTGRFIGVNLNVFNRSLFWWGEGDPMIFIDNDVWPPAIHGTGTEEFFNDAYGFHNNIESAGADPSWKEQNVTPVSGVLAPGLGAPAGCWGPNAVFSFQIADSIPFRERIRVTFEHGTENNRANDYSSTAYWYARPGATDFFTMRPVAGRINPLPEKWTAMRAAAEAKSLPGLRKRLAEIAADIRRRPTDAETFPKRADAIWGALMVPGTDKLPDAVRTRLQNSYIGKQNRPAPEVWRALDEVLLEIAERVLGKEQQ